MSPATRILILGAAGRDFHNFNVLYRSSSAHYVAAFTAQQIPHIANRRYPAELAGPLYPDGILIHPEASLELLIRDERIDRCVLSYSDLSYADVMHLASRVNAAGADFELLSAWRTMIPSRLPVISVGATRTGAGKSQTSRAIASALRDAGLATAVLRHPMPYGELASQRVQRFATAADLDLHRVTIEEREEYEPYLELGQVVYAGVDYDEIVRQAEAESDVLVWDGGNNDTPFLVPDVHIVVADPHRPGHERAWYPGETNVRMADVVIINKVDTALAEAVEEVRQNVHAINPRARIVEAASPLVVDDPAVIRDRKVLAIEDGPTLTHGGMAYGAAVLAARAAGAVLVDPRPFAVGEIADTFTAWPHIGPLLPAMGYGPQQIADLQETVRRAAAAGVEAIAVGTPIDVARILDLPVPHTRVRYELSLRGGTSVQELIAPVLERARRQAGV
ncbi:MAG TPA: GTP-binding protein [Longimicrobiales bacterium]|nr:GTP-binding protein [Longimicrobiales bacterium]